MNKKAIIFDLDGTLLNTLDDLRDSTNFALLKSGFKKRTNDEIRCFVGNGILKLVERAMPQNSSKQETIQCYNDFCEHYKKNMENKTAPYDGIIEMLKSLYEAGYKMAIVTNKADFAAQQLCTKLFGNYIKTIVGSVDERPNKPAPDGVYYAMEQMKVTKEETIFIGDSEVDIETANNAGIDSIGVLWGFRNSDDLAKVGVKLTVKTAKELQKKLLF
ncbi:MAG: HAD family hydrolase [Oscillospiraceae bacterium]